MIYNTTFEEAKQDKTYEFWHMERADIEKIWAKPKEYNTLIAYLEYKNHCLELEIDSDLEDGEPVIAYYMTSKENESDTEFRPDDWVNGGNANEVATFTSWEQVEEDMWNVLNNYKY